MNHFADESEARLAPLLERALDGDEEALADAFAHYRPRLLRMAVLRLDPRLQSRVDANDILQDVYLELSRQMPAYSRKREPPFFLWLRLVTRKIILRVHRTHFAAAKRDARLEISIHGGRVPGASSLALASQLVGSLTSPSGKAMQAEAEALLREVLETLDPVDREILSLRHIEDLTNSEAAAELGLKESTTSMRYARALGRLHDAIEQVPGLRSKP